MRLTKIDAAETHIAAAVRLFFQDAPAAPVYTLAAAAREILTTLGDKLGIETILHGFAEGQGIPLKEAISKAHGQANFFKHADRDADASIEFDEGSARAVLMIACHDFGRVAKGMPIEAQIFEAWWYATQTRKVSELPREARRSIRSVIRYFPAGMRSAPEPKQKRIGWEMLCRHEHDETLRMEIQREVILGDK